MDTMVSARVPVEIKKQGDRVLKEMGSSATELVNAAYRYVLEHGELPGREVAEPPAEVQEKRLAGEEARAFAQRWSARSVLDASVYDGANFKEMLDEARDEYYARFA